MRLNAPTGAWRSLTFDELVYKADAWMSQCTYRCVVLPDIITAALTAGGQGKSQCTYRCVVLPDPGKFARGTDTLQVSMHLQVRGAP